MLLSIGRCGLKNDFLVLLINLNVKLGGIKISRGLIFFLAVS